MRLRRASLPSSRDCAATRVTRTARATRIVDDDIEALLREMNALALPATRPHDAWRSSPDPVGLRRSSQTPSRSLAATRATRSARATRTDDDEVKALLREMRTRGVAPAAAARIAKDSLSRALPRAAAGAAIQITGQTQTRASESSRGASVLRRRAGRTARALLLGAVAIGCVWGALAFMIHGHEMARGGVSLRGALEVANHSNSSRAIS